MTKIYHDYLFNNLWDVKFALTLCILTETKKYYYFLVSPFLFVFFTLQPAGVVGSFFQRSLPSFHYLNFVSYYLSLKLLILGSLLSHQVTASFFRPLMSLKDGIDWIVLPSRRKLFPLNRYPLLRWTQLQLPLPVSWWTESV